MRSESGFFHPRREGRRSPSRSIIATLVLSGLLLGGWMGRPIRSEEVHPKNAWIMAVDGVINPVMASFVVETLDRAAANGAQFLIITLDTPGGLDLSMREIVKDLLSPPIPVVVFVYPQGSRAASAGVWITLAANVAAMAPGTNIGAAHPVMMIGGGTGGEGGTDEKGSSDTMEEKVLNDAVAYIRAVADQRGRNAEWAEKAVRESVSITAEEALSLGVIDMISTNVSDLLSKLDGRKVELNGEERILHTRGLETVRVEMPLRYRFLKTITDPNIALILMLLGALGIYFELSNPGLILPGVVGVISLVFALYAFHLLPINYAGLALIVLAIILFVAEVKIQSFGLLAVGGIISMMLGSLLLIDPRYPFLRISWSVIVPTVLFTAGCFLLLFGLVVKAHRRKPTTGREGLIGEFGVAETDLTPSGQVFIHGELWTAVGSANVEKGKRVQVVGIEHMTLKVKEVAE